MGVHVAIWEFLVKAESQSEFERRYGPDGDWARLFRRSGGYLGTRLMRDRANPLRYVTTDRWTSLGDWQAFREQHGADYATLDRECEGLTSAERALGEYEESVAVVRNWRAGDRESLLRFANNRNVSQNLLERFPHPYTEADADLWLGRTVDKPECTDWAIEVEGMAVGGIGVRPAENGPATTGHFGYWLGEPFWDRGIMTRVVRLVADHALLRLGYRRLEAPVFARNPASMRVLEKCGFRREDGAKQDTIKSGQPIETVLYVRLAPGLEE